MKDFFENFGGEYTPFREILLKFDKNYRKLCRLKLKFGPSSDRILQMRATQLKRRLKAYDQPLKEIALIIKKKEESDRAVLRKQGNSKK